MEIRAPCALCVSTGVLSFFFFSGELAQAAESSAFSGWLNRFTPKLNYYLLIVAVRPFAL